MLEAASGWLYRRGMSSFDYNAPAELFLSKPAKSCRTKYRRFATAAEAHAAPALSSPHALEAQKISERTRAGMARAKAKGIKIGRPKLAIELASSKRTAPGAS